MRREMGEHMVSAVILAAGESSRLGRPKQLVQFDGTTLIARAIETALASRCRDVTVVIGAHAEIIRPEAARYNVRIVDNAAWKEGKSSSIRAAISVASDRAAGILFMTCDQPYLTTEILDELITAFESSNDAPVACGYGGTVGIPAIIPRRLFPQLRELRSDDGARAILQAVRDEVIPVAWADGSLDIDSVEDVRQLTGDR
ncbi:MAG: nucleotidyltransferase family protein [candidate division Zixibacteria bacterium]|nr:nucleotidyltransferase family protein [candidate division Zixibacteria bacterium]